MTDFTAMSAVLLAHSDKSFSCMGGLVPKSGVLMGFRWQHHLQRGFFSWGTSSTRAWSPFMRMPVCALGISGVEVIQPHSTLPGPSLRPFVRRSCQVPLSGLQKVSSLSLSPMSMPWK